MKIRIVRLERGGKKWVKNKESKNGQKGWDPDKVDPCLGGTLYVYVGPGASQKLRGRVLQQWLQPLLPRWQSSSTSRPAKDQYENKTIGKYL